MNEITKHLFNKYHFQKIGKIENTEIDVHLFTGILRIHEIHYLFWSEEYKHFSIGIRPERPKGLPGKQETKIFNTIMIPKVIRTIEDADKLISGICDDLNLY